ncbi:MAG: amino acid adenylation domain-containing protein [Actinomycetota bacterium]
MSAPGLADFLTDLRARDVKLRLEGDQLRLQAPKGVITPELQLELKERKEQVVAFLRSAQIGRRALPPLGPRDRNGRIPLSYPQEGAWFMDRLQPGTTFNVFVPVRMSGALNKEALQVSLDEMVERHECLRTTFPAVDGQPVQVVNPPFRVPVSGIDLAGLPPGEHDAALSSVIVDATRSIFDLEKGPLLRMCLVQFGPLDHALILIVHHIVFDGWSTRVFNRELAEIFSANLTGGTSSLQPPVIQYGDFAIWERQVLGAEFYRPQLEYWKRQLASCPPGLQVAADRAPSGDELFKGDALWLKLPAELGPKLRALARSEGVTLFMLLLAAYKTLLMRYGGQQDVVVGTAVANRSQPQMANLIGFCVNLLPLRTDLSGNPSFRELVRRERDVCVGGFSNQEIPFGLVVQEVAPERTLGSTPLFQAQFALHEHEAQLEPLPGLPLKPLFERLEAAAELNRTLAMGVPAFDYFSMYVMEIEAGFTLTMHYRADLFEPEAIDQMLRHQLRLLGAIVADPDTGILDLPLTSPAERTRVLEELSADLPPVNTGGRLAHQLFEQQAQLNPDSIAVISPPTQANGFIETSLTYRELNARANQLARYLSSLSGLSEQRIGLCMDRSVEMLVAVMAVMKAGKTFVPLDHDQGRERLRLIIAESRIEVLLTKRGILGDFTGNGARLVELDSVVAQLARLDDANLDLSFDQNQLAYIVYTSGSTGKPKGVMVTHLNLVGIFEAWGVAYDLQDMACHLQMANFAFDLFIGDLTRALCSGAQLVLCPRDSLLVPGKLFGLLRDYRVECAEFVPAVVRSLLGYLQEQGGRLDFMKLIVAGSDRWSAAEYNQLRRAAGERTRVVNSYGLSEMTIDTCYFEDTMGSLASDQVLPVGRSFAGTEMYVLDARLEPVPVGIVGELYVGGANIPRGYLDDPRSSAQRYVPSEFSIVPGGRLYRTGDRARWRRDGQLEISGRIDEQIKMRGHRIEPGEIEVALKGFSGVQHSVVLAQAERDSQEQYLVAYVVMERGEGGSAAQAQADPAHALRKHLRARLPDYMVPAFFVFLNEFPLSPNGKVDRRSLPPHDPASGELQEEFEAPSTPVERELAKIWQRVLGVERVGARSDFFALGGHSLKASQVVHLIREELQIDLPLRGVFEAPTLRMLAHAVEDASNRSVVLEAITPASREEPLPVSYAQEGAWFMDQMQPGVVFNVVIPVPLTGDLDLGAVNRALAGLTCRHESLRTTFTAPDGIPFQIVHESMEPVLSVVDLRQESDNSRVDQLLELVIAEAQHVFDLETGPLLRSTVFRTTDIEQLVMLTVHHIVFDGHSVNVLVRDLAALYESERTGAPAALPFLPVQYADYAVWQRRVLSGEFLKSQLDYWQTQMAGCPTGLNLSSDVVQPEAELYRGSTVAIELPPDLSAAVRQLCQRQGVTLFTLLLAAYKALLARYTCQEDIVVGTPVANRAQAEMSDVIGFCVNMLALRTDLSGNPTFAELLQRERTVCMDGLSHQELPFGLLVQRLHPDRYLQRSPFFSVGFGLVQMEAAGSVSGLRSSALGLDVERLAAEVRDRAQISPSSDQLFLQVVDTGERIHAGLQHSSAMFTPETVEQMLGHFRRLLESAVDDPCIGLFDIPLLDEGDRSRLLDKFNSSCVDRLTGECLHQLFEAHAKSRPDALAVVVPGPRGSEVRITYGELNQRANRLAQFLRAEGIGNESRVAICLERGAEQLVAVLGCMKAGAAFVPMDPAQGSERLRYVLESSQVELVMVSSAASAADLHYRVAVLEDLQDRLAGYGAADPGWEIDDRQLAYLMFTSGSTGRPKAVMVAHSALANAFRAWENDYRLGELKCHLQMASFSFDVFMGDVARALGSGAALVMCPRESLLEGSELTSIISRYRVDCGEFVPAVARVLVEHLAVAGKTLDTMKLAIVGSDIWFGREYDEMRRLLNPGARLVNSYGVAEATIDSSYYESPQGRCEPGLVPIGRPFANTGMFVLDPYLNPVPMGAAGELYLAGPSLARGYSGQAAMTAERFIPNPFGSQPGDRLYRTGDRVRHLPEGDLAFIGRADSQIKLRGFRIEPGEIEAVLGEIEGVRQAAVLAAGTNPIDRHLVAYLAVGEASALTSMDLRRSLETRLPDYMVPSAFVLLDQLPLSPSGKVDRKALPDASGVRAGLTTEYVLPTTPTEIVLAPTWAEVLGVERVGIDDNFFALGGHSLLAARLVARVRDQFEVVLPLRALFEHPTVAGLARSIDRSLLLGEQGERKVDLVAEAVLPEDIRPGGPVKAGPVENVLLTGASGFLGAYLLRELMDQTKATIFCLVRAPNLAAAERRLWATLDAFQLSGEVDSERVVPIVGDLAQPRLGMSDADYALLAREVDVIYHNGAWVSSIYPYSMLKGSNVVGTEQILRLACHTRTKPVHYVSSLSVFAPHRWFGSEIEETFQMDSPEGLTAGYSQTKWVAEQLVNRAFDRGLPVTIYRPGLVAGDSTTGIPNDTAGMESLNKFLEMGVFPELEGIAVVEVVPVDYVTKAVIHLSRQESSVGRAFHIFNQNSASMTDLAVAFRRAGFSLRGMDARRFAVSAYQQFVAHPPRGMHDLIPLIPVEITKLAERWSSGSAGEELSEIIPAGLTPSVVHCEKTDAGLAQSNISCPPVSDLLDVYIEHLIRSGHLNPPPQRAQGNGR